MAAPIHPEFQAPSGHITRREETITPQRAAAILKANTRNRKIKQRVLARYIEDMRTGKWRPDIGDPIRISKTGRLLDGQHRLIAIVESGAKIRMTVIIGLDDEDQRYIDQGARRSAADQLMIEGRNNSGTLATIARNLLVFIKEHRLDQRVYAPSVYEIAEFVDEHAEMLGDIAHQYNRVKNQVPILTGPFGVLAFQALQKDEVKFHEFCDALHSGANLPPGSPILAFRNYVTKKVINRQRRTGDEELFLIIRTWNMWRAGKAVTRLNLPDKDKLIEIKDLIIK